MSYSFEDRSNGVYLLTGETHNNKDIVIKMDSIIKEEVYTECVERSTYNVVWKLTKNDNGLCLTAKMNNQIYERELNTETIVNELVSMVKENKTLEYCKNLLSEINELFNNIFTESLRDRGLVLTSNSIIKGEVKVSYNGKVIGYATRFLLDPSNRLYLCEYVGKNITRDMDINISVKINNQLIQLIFMSYVSDEEIIYSQSQTMFGYFGLNVRMRGVTVTSEDNIEYPELDTPKIYTTPVDMNRHCIVNNSDVIIQRYKVALKPKVQLMNINQFMLREFTV